ncbi:hypothetical protein MMC17_001158 [Xylographa soralifera]|nr:hypothetical protein [Xylographa soralifera]
MGGIMAFGFYKVGKGIREQKYVTPPSFPSLPFPSPPPSPSPFPSLPLPIVPPTTNTPPPNSELAREKMWSRIHLIPLLQAEEDRDLVRKHFADQAREKALLGTETSAYNGDRFVRPTFAITPQHVTK